MAAANHGQRLARTWRGADSHDAGDEARDEEQDKSLDLERDAQRHPHE